MSLSINTYSNFIQNNHFLSNIVTENSKHHVKIAAIALVIVAAIGSLFFLFRSCMQKQSVVPTPANPSIQTAPIAVQPLHSIQSLQSPFTSVPDLPSAPTEPFVKPIEPFSQPLPIHTPIQTAPLSVQPHPLPQPPITNLTVQPPVTGVKDAPFFKQVEAICSKISENIFVDPSFSAQSTFSAIDKATHAQVVSLFNELVAEFEKKYHVYQKIGYGDYVPAYFANVKNESDTQRKYLSLVGIRNMLKYGPTIFDDFREKKFIGGEHHYSNSKGLQAFKYYTGNAVDLDIQIDALNDQEALQIARERIVRFGKFCGLKGAHGGELTAEEVAQQMPNRKLHLPQRGTPVHNVGQSHTDRSNHGIWKRISPFNNKTHYFVNVPDCDLLLLATLRFPYMIAELAYRAKESTGGVLPKDFLDDFFQNGISDMCFNDKIRQFMEFYMIWSAKFDGSLQSPENEVRTNIEKGIFGEALRLKGADTAIKETYNRNKLIEFFNVYNYEYDSSQSEDQWVNNVIEGAIEILKVENLWENVLYRSGEGQNYFLLDKSTLTLFLKDYYTHYLVYL